MYKRFSKLRFYNKNGDPLNFDYDEDKEIWVGAMHLPEVSINLIENDTIYIVEEFQDAPSPTFNVINGTPHKDQSGTDPIINAKLEDKGSIDFFLFEVDNPLENKPEIQTFQETDIDIIDAPGDTFDSVTERLITSTNVNKAIRVDFGLQSQEEGAHERRLILSDDVGVIAEIELYGEVEAEDERFNHLLADMGWHITEREEFIFRQSDINEELPNFKILNRKRKELLLELHNIDPYLSGYKGIINILKYFGYYDVELKEYWKNTETDKMVIETVQLEEFDNLDVRNRFLDPPFLKTSFFGLFYDINRIVEGEFDELGLPITEDALLFSNEEILIKLFGLKNYMKERSIGGVAQIIDIIGEAVYFDKYDINTWRDQVPVTDIDLHVVPCFDCPEDDAYIIDVRPIINDYNCQLPRIYTSETTQYKFGNYPECYVGYFDYLNQEEPQFEDSPGIPVGYPLYLTNCSFLLPWQDVGMSWNDTNNASHAVTWESISHWNFYEVEWIVKRVQTQDDPRPFEVRSRGSIQDMEEILFILPFTGFYHVTLVLYGWNNEVSRHTEKNCVEVKTYDADFITFHRYHDGNLQNWEDNYLIWNETHEEWNSPIFDNIDFIIGADKIQNRSYHIINYIGTDKLGIKGVGINSPTWDEFFEENVSWNDYKYQTWLYLNHPLEKLARFVITKLQAGGKLQVGEDVYTLPSSINIYDYEPLATLLNAETGNDISLFDFLARTVDMNVTSTFIDATSQLQGREGDRFIGASGGVEIATEGNLLQTWATNNVPWIEFPIHWENCDFAFATQAVENPFSMDNVRVFDDRFDMPLLAPLFMVVDNSKMAGKTRAYWKITNVDTGQVVLDIESFTMVIRFALPGSYTVECTIWDTNDNQNYIIKEKHIRVYEPNEYENKLIVENILIPETV